MLAGLPYRPDTEELREISTKAHRLCRDYNQTADEDREVRKAIIDNLFPNTPQCHPYHCCQLPTLLPALPRQWHFPSQCQFRTFEAFRYLHSHRQTQ